MSNPPTAPTFSVHNLGSVRQGQFTQKPLTLFCGPNNSGKTWTLYSLYYCWRRLNIADDNADSDLAAFNKHTSKNLHVAFNTPAELLAGARFDIDDIDPRQFVDPEEEFTDVFLMPAERNGLHLFFRELSARRTALLHHASRENINIQELLRDVTRSRYATPIADYIDWLNDLADIKKSKSKSEGLHHIAKQLEKDLAGGAYTVDARTGSIEFKPYQTKRDGKKTNTMGLHITSSTVKSLFGLWFYLEHQAYKGSVLMIDEPELNIHPENQRKIARLLAKLVNAGLQIVVSTHSDYMVREFNSLIMLSQDKDKKLRKKHHYADDEILQPEQVGAYLFDDQKITPFEISAADGICATTFDQVIKDLNEVNDDIYYSLQEAGNEPDDGPDDEPDDE